MYCNIFLRSLHLGSMHRHWCIQFLPGGGGPSIKSPLYKLSVYNTHRPGNLNLTTQASVGWDFNEWVIRCGSTWNFSTCKQKTCKLRSPLRYGLDREYTLPQIAEFSRQSSLQRLLAHFNTFLICCSMDHAQWAAWRRGIICCGVPVVWVRNNHGVMVRLVIARVGLQSAWLSQEQMWYHTGWIPSAGDGNLSHRQQSH